MPPTKAKDIYSKAWKNTFVDCEDAQSFITNLKVCSFYRNTCVEAKAVVAGTNVVFEFLMEELKNKPHMQQKQKTFLVYGKFSRMHPEAVGAESKEQEGMEQPFADVDSGVQDLHFTQDDVDMPDGDAGSEHSIATTTTTIDANDTLACAAESARMAEINRAPWHFTCSSRTFQGRI